MRRVPNGRRMAQPHMRSELPKLLTIAGLATTVAIALTARNALSADIFPAMVATAAFGFAALATLAAWLLRGRAAMRLGWLDLAGIFTCIGIVVSLMIEPEEAAQLVAAAPRSE